ncbi:NAD(P)/FAD-dependent oxidoreductase [Ascidiimonas sp. W6]|uniref:NAD(P)/FAD-dependent oxidoreductase n=1 Tax=Ascidiimonas meishanensis TaxID=3128903 RepID=UPI0030ED141D
MIDYIVVGLGLAGMAFCETLEKQGKSFVVFDDGSQKSSGVAGGLYNPVILKRFTKVWMAQEQLAVAMPFYEQLEKKFQEKYDYKVPVYRRFTSVEEQNLWFEAADKPRLSEFMSLSLHKNQYNHIHAPFGFGEVLQTGRVDTAKLQRTYANFLKKYHKLREETFVVPQIQLANNYVAYKDIKAKHIVFADGFGMKSNPYFNYLPLNGTKGQLVTIEAPDLQLDFVLKSSVFIIPQGNHLYRIGATYEWEDKTNTTTVEAREELLTKLETFMKCSYEVVHQEAGIRPTVTDRRPLVGRHPIHKHLFLLNGMGSRGVMIAPYIAIELFNFIESKTSLPPEIDIQRFHKKFMNR